MDAQTGKPDQKYVEIERVGDVLIEWLQGTNIARVTAGGIVSHYEFPDEPRSEAVPPPEIVTKLGEEYWTTAFQLIEECHKQGVDQPVFSMPMIQALILAESMEIPDEDQGIAKLYLDARSGVLSGIKEVLDYFKANGIPQHILDARPEPAA